VRDVESRYRELADAEHGFRMFIKRCRRLKDIRDEFGLRCVVFSPKLLNFAQPLTREQWTERKLELHREKLARNVDKIVADHCPRWLEGLKRGYSCSQRKTNFEPKYSSFTVQEKGCS
jgi:hypothetical protein